MGSGGSQHPMPPLPSPSSKSTLTFRSLYLGMRPMLRLRCLADLDCWEGSAGGC
jgi:hypothetical protein